MNESVYYDIRFESQYGDSYEITTTILDKAVFLYGRLKGMKNCIVVKRELNEHGDEIENDFTKNIELLSEIF